MLYRKSTADFRKGISTIDGPAWLPAGLAFIATSAAIGAGAGAVTGAATGESPTMVAKMTTIAHSDPAYGTWQRGIVVANAFVLFP
jgi:hypothetical protein